MDCLRAETEGASPTSECGERCSLARRDAALYITPSRSRVNGPAQSAVPSRWSRRSSRDEAPLCELALLAKLAQALQRFGDYLEQLGVEPQDLKGVEGELAPEDVGVQL